METDVYGNSGLEQAVKCCQASIILPVYNEQACINQTFDAVLAYARCHSTYRFIFVNDGSSDRTQQILEHRIAGAKTRQIEVITCHDRGGKGRAVQRGIEVADGDYVCFLDGDLAYSLDHLDQLFASLEFHDVVIGSRGLAAGNNRGLRLTRRVAGKVFNSLSRFILNLNYPDMQAGLKGFKYPVARTLFARQKLRGFSFDVELIYLARKLGYSIAEIPARVSASHLQKTSKVNLVLDSLRMLGDLFWIRLNDLMGQYE
jgi:glycosyltransferase involved in cell wall biosynthesis